MHKEPFPRNFTVPDGQTTSTRTPPGGFSNCKPARPTQNAPPVQARPRSHQGGGRSWAKTQIQNREVSTMPQPKIYAAVLNHFGSLSDLAATLGATVVGETLCFSGLTGQAVSDLMEQHGLDYNYSGTPEAAKEADQ